MLTREQTLIRKLDAFNKRFGLRPYYAGKTAVGNARLYDQLVSGADVSQSVYERVIQFIEKYSKQNSKKTAPTKRGRK